MPKNENWHQIWSFFCKLIQHSTTNTKLAQKKVLFLSSVNICLFFAQLKCLLIKEAHKNKFFLFFAKIFLLKCNLYHALLVIMSEFILKRI
ncbi:hypothetical protein C7N43_07055 [Sphingobacteriales bacterium UPWRP_1]|nr:hypothetical protein B6N25_04545 [Sphingobacteriales bacterium TSM_CSS]PSJ77740.1 hypothetical protein C7N43_07055 [Sphingobacteriales bacterium UPWRP_1]